MKEKILVFIGVIFSCSVGVSVPLSILLFSDLFGKIYDPSQAAGAMMEIIHYFAILGGVTYACGFIQMLCLQTAAKLASRRIRETYFRVNWSIFYWNISPDQMLKQNFVRQSFNNGRNIH